MRRTARRRRSGWVSGNSTFYAKLVPFLCKTDHFTKTGSGQTWGKHPKKCRFLAGGEARHTQAVEFLLQPRVRTKKETPLSA